MATENKSGGGNKSGGIIREQAAGVGGAERQGRTGATINEQSEKGMKQTDKANDDFKPTTDATPKPK